jgi:hypothetical protein
MTSAVVAVTAPVPLPVVAVAAAASIAPLPVVSRVVPGRASADVLVAGVERSAGRRVAGMPVIPALVGPAAMCMGLARAAVRIMRGVMSPATAGLRQIVAVGVAMAFASVVQPERNGFFV